MHQETEEEVAGIELTSFKQSGGNPMRRRKHSPSQVQNLWGFKNCFCHIQINKDDQRVLSSLQYVVINSNRVLNQNGIRNQEIVLKLLST